MVKEIDIGGPAMYSGVLDSDAATYSAQISVINALFIAFLIWDGINDPLFGIILERCHLRGGKFRPWILIGGVLNSIVVALLFCVRPKGWAFVTYWAIFYFLWDAVFTLNDIGYWSMLPSMQHFVNDCVIQAQYKEMVRPVVYNNWEATMFDFSKPKLVSLMELAFFMPYGICGFQLALCRYES